MDYMELIGQNIITQFHEKPWKIYLTLAIIGISLLVKIIHIVITTKKVKNK